MDKWIVFVYNLLAFHVTQKIRNNNIKKLTMFRLSDDFSFEVEKKNLIFSETRLPKSTVFAQNLTTFHMTQEF